MPEQKMIEQIKNRDETGMTTLFEQYSPLMRYIIAPILPNTQDQEDCLSEATMRIWDKIALFDQQHGSFKAWLTAVTRNTALNYARKSARLHSTEEISESIPSSELTPEESILQQERHMAVRHALGQLSAKESMLFYRKYYYLQSTAQIASELGMTERAVEGKLYRLKKRLRKMLGGDGYESF